MVEPGDPLSHFIGPDVLDPLFQQLVARRIPLGKAMREIMEALQGGDLCLSVRVAGSVRALQPMHFATKEEEEQAREEYRAAVAKYDYDAAEDVIYGTSPPGGIIGPLDAGDWGHKVTLGIRDRHLLIKWLDPLFPPEFHKYAIVNPEAVDRLLAAASPAHASSAAGSLNLPVGVGQLSHLQEMERAGFFKGAPALQDAADYAREAYRPDGYVPDDLTPTQFARGLENWLKARDKAKAVPDQWHTADRFLKEYRRRS
jgi:hypothetical protein